MKYAVLSLMKVPAADKCAVLISRQSLVFQAERSALYSAFRVSKV